jgi:hypothetical protein
MAELRDEIAAYEAMHGDLEAAHPGEWALVHDRQLQRLPVDLNQDGFRGPGEALWH